MCNNNESIKDLTVVDQSKPTVLEKQFPLCLLDKNSYIGFKGLVGIFFWVALIYFGYGIVHFFMWDNTFWGVVWNIFSKPIYLIYHVCVFSFMYCLTWAVFDSSSFKNSLTRVLLIIASIVYIISPIDAIPDITPFLGQADDLLALIIGILNAFSLMKNRTKIIKK